MRNLGPEWIAAIALSIQALIFALQAGFLCWQARILRRHARTLDEHTQIAATQAETLKLMGQALDQQGKILTEQTKIMDEQFKFQRKVDAKAERANALTLVVTVHARLQELESRLSLIQQRVGFNATQEDHKDVARYFDALAGAVYECQKVVFMAIHLATKDKTYFLAYCDDLSTLNRTGNMADDLNRVHALRAKYGDVTFFMRLGSLGDIPESSA